MGIAVNSLMTLIPTWCHEKLTDCRLNNYNSSEAVIAASIMGQTLTSLRDPEAAQKLESKEKIAVLEKLANAQLLSKKDLILHGMSDDEEIHAGKVVTSTKQIFVDASAKPKAIEGAISNFFDGEMKDGVMKLIVAGVNELLGNFSIGESEVQDMLIVWENNSLLRVDIYYWKWNFSSKGVMSVAQNIFAVYCVKRVINPFEVDPDVLIWAISRMCSKKGMKDAESLKYVHHIMEEVKTIKDAILMDEKGAKLSM